VNSDIALNGGDLDSEVARLADVSRFARRLLGARERDRHGD
jgi:hypothetical protein